MKNLFTLLALCVALSGFAQVSVEDPDNLAPDAEIKTLETIHRGTRVKNTLVLTLSGKTRCSFILKMF